MKDWVPLLGSSLIALVTLVVLIVTVRQNQRALSDARDRAYEEWERETITSSTAKAVEAAGRIAHELRLSVSQTGMSHEFTNRIHAEVAVIFSSAAVLELFARGNLARQCRNLATTSQKATAHMLLNWHEAKQLFKSETDIPPALQRIYEWSDSVESASAQLCNEFRRALPPVTSSPRRAARNGSPPANSERDQAAS